VLSCESGRRGHNLRSPRTCADYHRHHSVGYFFDLASRSNETPLYATTAHRTRVMYRNRATYPRFTTGSAERERYFTINVHVRKCITLNRTSVRGKETPPVRYTHWAARELHVKTRISIRSVCVRACVCTCITVRPTKQLLTIKNPYGLLGHRVVRARMRLSLSLSLSRSSVRTRL
jgi:hypothetical protein